MKIKRLPDEAPARLTVNLSIDIDMTDNDAMKQQLGRVMEFVASGLTAEEVEQLRAELIRKLQVAAKKEGIKCEIAN